MLIFQICRAKELFKKFYDTSFQFENCWNILRNSPKWVDHKEKEKPKRRSTATPFTQELIKLGEDDASQAALVDLEKPLGRKSKKARLSKRKISDSLCSNLEGISSDIQEQKKLKFDGKKEILERACSQTEELIQIRKVEVDKATARDEEFIQLR